jgi:MYXO-CTERM domain-containing protein
VCAQPCSNATCSCPGGSSCLSVASERMCMRDCSPGTCPQGLECNPVGEGYACIPACQKLTDCPSGFVCNGGRCTNPQTPVDGGCTLCSDGGPPPPPPPPGDGGPPGDDTPEGCGCSGGPGSALLFLAVIALLLMGGRHSWSRR